MAEVFCNFFSFSFLFNSWNRLTYELSWKGLPGGRKALRYNEHITPYDVWFFQLPHLFITIIIIIIIVIIIIIIIIIVIFFIFVFFFNDNSNDNDNNNNSNKMKKFYWQQC